MLKNTFANNRTYVLALTVVVVMAVFVLRLFWLQVIQHDEYVAMANREQLKRLVIPAKRGTIYAMDGKAPVRLVMNETVYTAFVDPAIVGDVDEIEGVFKRVAGGNLRGNPAELIRAGKDKESRYEIIATRLTRKQAEMIKKEGLTGVGFQEVSQRVYPEGKLAAQALGFVNAEGKGQYGIEGALDERLNGQDGLLQSVTDISNVPLTIGKQNIDIPAKNGEDIVLSIDRNVQSKTEQALADGLKKSGATHGSVVVMNPQNGKVMAMANLPTYDPAEFYKVTDRELFKNAAAAVPYEAGSVIKAFTVAMGLDKGVITPDSTYVNTNRVKVDDRVITNAFKDRTGTITMQEALNFSLNTGMVHIAQRLGDGSIDRKSRDIMYDYFHNKFGLGELTGLEIAGEVPGAVISPKETEGNAVRYSNMSFGQGMDVTMVQVAAALGSVINGGTYYQPSLIAGSLESGELKPKDPNVVRSGVISRQASDNLRRMMESARHSFYGSQDKAGFKIGGKTGTSQTIQNGRYVDNQTIGTYLGYGGDNQPRYVIMVQVSGENMNLEGGKHASPIFTEISNWMIDYLKLQPKG